MKFKLLLVITSFFLLVGCQNEVDEDMGVFILEYPNEYIEIEGIIGDKVVLPQLSKDDYVFIGWTDGEDYYAGLTEVLETEMTLSPAYEPIESVFSKVEVSLGQVNLIDYHGSSNIVGLPAYWNDYLVVGFSSKNLNVEKLFIPNSVKLYNRLNNLTDYVVYGHYVGLYHQKQYPGSVFQDLISTCTYDDGQAFNIDQASPGLFNEDCEIKALIKRNDDSAVPVPGKGTTYTYDLVVENDFSSVNNLSVLPYKTIEYMSFSQVPYIFMQTLSHLKHYESLEVLDLGQIEGYEIEDNKVYLDVNDTRHLIFIFSNEERLMIDGEEVTVEPEFFHIGGAVKYLDIENHESMQSINGIVYAYPKQFEPSGEWSYDEDHLQLLIYPSNHPDTSYVFPDNVTQINRYVYNNHIETVTVNDFAYDVSRLKIYFPNLKNIHVPDDHPYLIEDNGVIYNKEKTHIHFVNEDVTDIVLPHTIEEIQTSIHDLNSITISSQVKADIGESLFHIEHIDNIIFDEANPYMVYQDGAIYDQETMDLLFIKRDIEHLSLNEQTESLDKANLYNLSLNSIELNEHMTDQDLLMLEPLYNLHSITVDEDNPYIVEVDGLIYSKDLSRLLYIPKAIEKETITIPASVTEIDLNPWLHFPNVGRLEVEESNPNFRSIDGIIYNKSLTELLFVHLDDLSDTYHMPDQLQASYDMLFGVGDNHSSVNIGRDYIFVYEPDEPPYYIDPMSNLVFHFDEINIHSDSPYYDGDYHIITNLEQDLLIALTGNNSSYEIPSYIDTISPYVFSKPKDIQTLTVSSNLSYLPDSVFAMESLDTLTIKGFDLLKVQGLEENDLLNYLGDHYHYYFTSSDLIVYVEAAMVGTYERHPFWSLFDIRIIE